MEGSGIIHIQNFTFVQKSDKIINYGGSLLLCMLEVFYLLLLPQDVTRALAS